jgi:hypothetical protein
MSSGVADFREGKPPKRDPHVWKQPKIETVLATSITYIYCYFLA